MELLSHGHHRIISDALAGLFAENGDGLFRWNETTDTFDRYSAVIVIDETVFLTATTGDDTCIVEENPENLVIKLNTTRYQFNIAKVRKLHFFGLDGVDIFRNFSHVESTVWGGNGDDSLSGGSGHDVLNGGNGQDEVSYAYVDTEDDTRGVTIDLIAGMAQIAGEEFDDLVSIERVVGSDGIDEFYIADAHTVRGGPGDDRFFINGLEYITDERITNVSDVEQIRNFLATPQIVDLFEETFDEFRADYLQERNGLADVEKLAIDNSLSQIAEQYVSTPRGNGFGLAEGFSLSDAEKIWNGFTDFVADVGEFVGDAMRTVAETTAYLVES
ncbi:MAG: hypothetical protein KDA87_27235, partial [Planctomycetales bacterium]|nr:hypothetical protein [Planctomycetales bacterium]